MESLVVGFWIVIFPVRFVYFICLFGVTIEDILWLGQEEETESDHYKPVKLSRVIVLIFGVGWLCSHMGVGLVCLVICSIAYSIRDTRSAQYNEPGDSSKSENNIARFLNMFQLVRCILRYIAGIVCMSSHLGMLLYLSPIAAGLVCVFVIWFRAVGPQKILTNAVEDNEVVEPHTANARQNFIERSLNFICSSLVCSFILYKAIIFMSKFVWGNLCGRWLPIESAPNISVCQSNANKKSMPKSGSGATYSSWQATIGQNVNHGGTQTIGSVTIGDYNYEIRIHCGRDIIFNNTYVTRDVSRNWYDKPEIVMCSHLDG